MSMHSGRLELTKLTSNKLEDDLTRRRGDLLKLLIRVRRHNSGRALGAFHYINSTFPPLNSLSRRVSFPIYGA